jgi:hypothetical protein
VGGLSGTGGSGGTGRRVGGRRDGAPLVSGNPATASAASPAAA